MRLLSDPNSTCDFPFDWKVYTGLKTTPESGMKIGELAKVTGVMAKTIRFYEQEEVLPKPERTSSSYRKYGP